MIKIRGRKIAREQLSFLDEGGEQHIGRTGETTIGGIPIVIDERMKEMWQHIGGEKDTDTLFLVNEKGIQGVIKNIKRD